MVVLIVIISARVNAFNVLMENVFNAIMIKDGILKRPNALHYVEMESLQEMRNAIYD